MQHGWTFQNSDYILTHKDFLRARPGCIYSNQKKEPKFLEKVPSCITKYGVVRQNRLLAIVAEKVLRLHIIIMYTNLMDRL